MKKIISTTIALILSSTVGAFQCDYNGAQAQCTVQNNFDFPSWCHIQARGFNASGATVNVQKYVTIAPQQDYVVVFNGSQANPIVYAEASADCQYQY